MNELFYCAVVYDRNTGEIFETSGRLSWPHVFDVLQVMSEKYPDCGHALLHLNSSPGVFSCENCKSDCPNEY